MNRSTRRPGKWLWMHGSALFVLSCGLPSCDSKPENSLTYDTQKGETRATISNDDGTISLY
ncbi:MAG: hypothetical protein ACK5NN_03580, partial [Sphingomonadaceae bacterium]